MIYCLISGSYNYKHLLQDNKKKKDKKKSKKKKLTIKKDNKV